MKQINWKVCHCHNSGQTGDLSNFSEQTLEMLRKAAEIRNDLVHILLKHYWSAGNCYFSAWPKTAFHRWRELEKWLFSREKIGIGLWYFISGNENHQYLTYFETLAPEIERNIVKALKVVTMSENKSRFFSFLVRKSSRPQIASPCICEKAREKNASQTNFYFGGQMITFSFFVMTLLKGRSLRQL